MKQVSDHYMVVSKSYYNALRNQMSLLNTRISKLMFNMVFFLSLLYFVYVYFRLLFSGAIISDSKSSVLNLFFNVPKVAGDNESAIMHEMTMTFLLITFLIIENKIIDYVGELLGKKKEMNPEEMDPEKSSVSLLAHLDLYILKRVAIERNAMKDISKAATGEDKKLKGRSLEEEVDDKEKFLNTKMEESYDNRSFQTLVPSEENKRILNDDILNRIRREEPIDDLAEDTVIRLNLNEKTSYTQKIIFFNFIKTHYSVAQFAYALLYSMQRIGVVFLTVTITVSPTVPNIVLISCIFFLQWTKNGYSDKISILCLIACCLILKDDIFLLLSETDSWKKSGSTGKPLDTDKTWRFFLYFNSWVIYFSTIFMCFSNLFILITIGISKFIIININTHHFTKASIFWSFQTHKGKKNKKSTKILVNHKVWASKESSFVASMTNIFFVYPLEIYIIAMLTIAIIPNTKGSWVLGFTAIPYLLSLVNFGKKEYRNLLQKLYFKYYIILCWIFLLCFYLVNNSLIKSADDTAGQIDFSVPIVILINEFYKDILYLDDFVDRQDKLNKNKGLLSSLINYNYTYEYNSQKLVDNINIFTKQSHVIECTEKISNESDTNINLQTNLIDDLFKYDDSILKIVNQKSTFWAKYRIKFYTFLYKFLMDLNYKEIFESVFYLYSSFKKRNRNVINESELNLNQFLKLESDMMVDSIKQVEMFYRKLREKDPEKIEMFHEKMEKIKSQKGQLETDEKLEENREATKMEEEPLKNEKNDKGGPTLREDINHKEAAEKIFDFINQPTKIKKDNDDNFIFQIKSNKDLIFTNIQPYFVEQSEHFTKFDSVVIFKLFLGIFMSNMQMIIIIIITGTHVVAGGIYPIIVFTILFFILIEERPGRFYLWTVLAVIYIFVIIVGISLTISKEFEPMSQQKSKGIRTRLPDPVLSQFVLLFYGKVGSVFFLCIIFFLIILLRINFEKLGFFNKDLLMVENLPTAVHRVHSGL
jgi:hypothetical protein